MSESEHPIAVCGDWHGSTGWPSAPVSAAADAGARTLLHCGDLGLDFPGRRRGRFEAKLNRALESRDLNLILVPGNHENHATIRQLSVGSDGLASFLPRIKILPFGYTTCVEGLIVGGLGGAFSIDQSSRKEGIDWWPTEEPSPEDAARLLRGKEIQLLVTHDVPVSVPLQTKMDLPASIIQQANRTRILLEQVMRELRPLHIFAGHHHQRVTHYVHYEDGKSTRIDVLANEKHTMGNAVLIWPGSGPPLQVEPLKISTR